MARIIEPSELTAKKKASRRTLGSDLARVDAHVIEPSEYEELPELTDQMIARAVVRRGGRRVPAKPLRRYVRLPSSVIDRWRASGPGWRSRMAAYLAKADISKLAVED